MYHHIRYVLRHINIPNPVIRWQHHVFRLDYSCCCFYFDTRWLAKIIRNIRRCIISDSNNEFSICLNFITALIFKKFSGAKLIWILKKKKWFSLKFSSFWKLEVVSWTMFTISIYRILLTLCNNRCRHFLN